MVKPGSQAPSDPDDDDVDEARSPVEDPRSTPPPQQQKKAKGSKPGAAGYSAATAGRHLDFLRPH